MPDYRVSGGKYPGSRNRKAVIPTEVLRLLYRFPLPFAGITQTGSEGLPIPLLRDRDSQPNELP
jgi:hypothetical protein